MCGIVGVAGRIPAATRERLPAMRDSLRHRGPDDAGIWWSADGDAALAQRRLSVIDLSPLGHQPMTCAQGDLALVLNGEIYNYPELRVELEKRGHEFRSTSDTEVLLEAYQESGTDVLRQLNGMFAFALYDGRKRRLFLARDRAGEKPLFYLHRHGALWFSSELKALLVDPSLPREIDADGLESYLAYGYVPGERCILRGFRKLRPGHALEYDVGGDALREWCYWELPAENKAETADAEELIGELTRLLRDSVKRQLAADVPVGILLSGGVDSGLVTAMAAHVSGRPVHTFTVGFPGYGAFDERPEARAIAAEFGTCHEELIAEPASVDLLPELARQYDEPIADSSMVPTYMVTKLIRRHATVALGGDGGDELFGGYPHYRWLLKLDRVRRVVPGPLRSLFGRAATTVLPPGFRGRHYLAGVGAGAARSLSLVNLYFDERGRAKLLRRCPDVDGQGMPETERERLFDPACSLVRNAMKMDFRNYLVDDVLVKVDRASMLNSLEVRSPWLDYRIIEFAFSRVPDEFRAGRNALKVLPKRLAERLFPRTIDLTRKRGFSIPIDDWLRAGWLGFIEEVLREADPELFDPGAIRRLIDLQRRGYANGQRLFALSQFELWRREYKVALPGMTSTSDHRSGTLS